MESTVQPTGRERTLDQDAFIVSKTDRNGRIVYANRTFIELAGFREADLLGSNHRVVRHPDMPRGMFKLMWDELKQEKPFRLYIVSLGRDGSHYWGYANMVPSFDAGGQVIGYFSVRRRPNPQGLQVIRELYRAMREEESRSSGDGAIRASLALLNNFLAEKGMSYDEFIVDLQA